MMDTKQRFMKYVDKTDTCWNWTGGLVNGYGQFYAPQLGTRIASKISWLLFRGTIPDDLHVLHKCDNRACVNPSHLYLGTLKQNTKDMIDRGRRYQPHCRGDKNGRSKLSWDKIRDIRKNRNDNKTPYRKLCAMYGVCLAVIRDIINNKIWIE